MNAIQAIYTLLDNIAEKITKCAGIIVVIALGLLVLDLGICVILRYLVGYTPAWYEDMAKVLLVWVTFSGAIIVTNRLEHISILIFPPSFPKQFHLCLAILAQIIVIITSVFVVLYGYHFAMSGFRGYYPSIDILPLFVAYVAVPLSYVCILLITVRNLFGLFTNPDKYLPVHH